MKRILPLLGVLSVLAYFTAQASAVTIITAGGGPPSAEGWTLAAAGGGGDFGPADPNANGGGAASVVAGPPAWGLFAPPGASATADFSFPALTPGEPMNFVSIGFDNGFIDPGAVVGVQFLAGGGASLEFEYLFVGGAASWAYSDGSVAATPSPTPFSADGFHFKMSITAPGMYDFFVDAAPGPPMSAPLHSGTLGIGGTPSGSSTIDTVRVVNFGAGSGPAFDVVFNELVINVPEPSRAMLLMLGAVGLVARRRR